MALAPASPLTQIDELAGDLDRGGKPPQRRLDRLRSWPLPGAVILAVGTDLKGFSHTGAFTHWMGLDPTDTPMLIRDVGSDDIYALTLEQK